MKTFIEISKSFLNDEAGMEMSEYAVVGVIIAVATAVAFVNLSKAIGDGIQLIINCVQDPQACGTP